MLLRASLWLSREDSSSLPLKKTSILFCLEAVSRSPANFCSSLSSYELKTIDEDTGNGAYSTKGSMSLALPSILLRLLARYQRLSILFVSLLHSLSTMVMFLNEISIFLEQSFLVHLDAIDNFQETASCKFDAGNRGLTQLLKSELQTIESNRSRRNTVSRDASYSFGLRKYSDFRSIDYTRTVL
jgi:hypothetical protein